MIKRILGRMSNLTPKTHSVFAMDDSTFIDFAYHFILRRAPDRAGKKTYLNDLAKGNINRDFLLKILGQSEEFRSIQIDSMGLSIHQSRIQWVKSLPKADYILDLGGASKGSKEGALVAMGYPYKFKELTIVDLPLDERHSLYAEGYDAIDSFVSSSGRIRYIYTSMTNLSQFADSSMDFINCGQTIEHIMESESDRLFKECLRILKPGTYFCLDTPNAQATRVQQDEFIDPDHKIEYRHEELNTKLENAGFQIMDSKGINYLPESIRKCEFDENEVTKNYGIFDDIENCYILAYRCQKPI